MDSQEQETVYQGSLEIIGCTHLKVIVLCVDLITINISIIIIILIGTRMIVMMSIGARRTVRLAANTGRSHRSGRCPTHNDRWRRGHEQPETTRMKAGPVAVHQDHCGGKVERACGQDPVRGFAVERLAGHQSSWVVVVAWKWMWWKEGITH